MELASLCLVISATLNIQPDRSQYFRYERISLTCTEPTNSTGWTLRKHGSSEKPEPCDDGCVLRDVYPSYSGVYWCESAKGECSNAVNITVTAGVVILESPALPVAEGDTVTLRCSYRERFAPNPSSDFNATFYKDNLFFGTEPAGTMIIHSVAKSDEGFYKCRHPEKGESLPSWLSVRAQPPHDSPTPPVISLPNLLCTILLFLLYTMILILCICVYRKWARARANAKKRAADHLDLEQRQRRNLRN